jgi:hypothetical protein
MFFPVKGVYSTFVIPDMNRQQAIKGLVKILVEQFDQAQYTFPLPLPIPLNVPLTPPREIPPSIMSVDQKLITVKALVTIKGIAFNKDEIYQCAFLPEIANRTNIQFTNAQFVDKETQQWNFRYIHTTGMIGCG